MGFNIEVFAEQDDIPVRGNAMASGDDDFDREVEDEILADLDQGNVWSWGFVTVQCTCDDCGAVGGDTLGGCSYASEEDFKADAYYADMLANAQTAMRQECTCFAAAGTADGAACAEGVQ